MRRPYGAESHATSGVIERAHNLPHGTAIAASPEIAHAIDRTHWTLASLILPALAFVYRSDWPHYVDVAEAFDVYAEDVDHIEQTITGCDPLPSDWRERGWCPGLHEVTP